MTDTDFQQLNYDVFISYRHIEPDMSWVRETLVPRLKAEGLRVFIDVEQFVIGKSVISEMERGIQQSRYTLAVMSPGYLAGDFAKYENVIARHYESEQSKSRFLMVIREQCELPLRLRKRLYIDIDMTDDKAFEHGSNKLCSILRPRKVFLVYAETDEDVPWVKGFLIPGLGRGAWVIERKNNFQLGAITEDETDNAITDSDHTLLVLSPAFFDDEWASEVLNRAIHLGLEDSSKQPLLLKLSACQMPENFAIREFLDFSQCSVDEALLKKLRTTLKLPENETEPFNPECPYLGMVPFKEEDAKFFYGRDTEIEVAKKRLRNKNYLFVIGSSGSGKSSLVFAGIIPAIKKGAPEEWIVKSFRPGEFPVTELKKTLDLSSVSPKEGGKGIIDSDCINRLLAKSPTAHKLLLIIDQLEELFARAKTEYQSNFFDCLKDLILIPECKIILTMRADFYPDLMKCDLWSRAKNSRLEVTALTSDLLAQALEEPARAQNVFLEKGLREHLLADAANEPGVLPLIQETMQQLWDKRVQHLLTLGSYIAMSTDARSGLTMALSEKVKATFDSLNQSENNKQHKVIAKRIFLRLIQFGVGRSDTRRQQSKEGLMSQDDDSEAFKNTIKHLVENRLLTLDSDLKNGNKQNNEPDIKVDISHEALISGWSELQEWIEQHRESELDRRHLEERASFWINNGGSIKSSGLFDEVELTQATTWFEKNGVELGYSSDLYNLCKVSHTKINRVIARKRLVSSVLILLFMATLLFLMATIFQMNKSQFYRKNAKVSRIVDTAEVVRDKGLKQLPLSTLLALESITPELGSGFIENLFPVRTNTLSGARVLRENLAVLAERKAIYTTEGESINAIIYSPDGSLFASARGDQVCIWEMKNYQQTFCLPHDAKVTSLIFGHHNARIFTASKDKQLKSWNAKTGELLWVATSGETLKSIVLNHEGTLLAGADGKTVQLWFTYDGTKGSVFNHGQTVKTIAFAPASGFLNSASNDKAIVWDVDTKEINNSLVFNAHVKRLTYSPDGQFLAAEISNSKTVSVWDLRYMTKILDMKQHDSIYTITFDQESKFLAVGGKDGISRVWRLADGLVTTSVGSKIYDVPLDKIKIQPPGGVLDIAFSKDGRYIATASTNFIVSVWERKNSNEFLHMVHDTPVMQLVFDPNGDAIASLTMASSIGIWGLKRGDELAHLIHDNLVTNVSFSPDGRFLCTIDGNSQTYVWEINTSKKVSKPGHGCVAKDLLTQASGYKALIDMDTDTVSVKHHGEVIGQAIHAHVDLAVISADGKFLATADNKWIRIWQWQTNGQFFAEKGQFTPVAEIRDNQSGINDIAFSPDHRYLATAGSDHTARIWYLQNADLIDKACSRLSKKNLSEEEWKEHIYEGDYRETCPE